MSNEQRSISKDAEREFDRLVEDFFDDLSTFIYKHSLPPDTVFEMVERDCTADAFMDWFQADNE